MRGAICAHRPAPNDTGPCRLRRSTRLRAPSIDRTRRRAHAVFNHKLTRPGAIACVLSVIATLSANAGQPLATDNGKALASLNPSNNVEVDVNLGLANTYGVGTYALAGAALQYALFDRLQLLSEIFRDEPGRSKFQLGARYVAIRNRLEVYLSY